MGVCFGLKKTNEVYPEDEIDELGWDDTDSEIVVHEREKEDRFMSFSDADLSHLLAVRTKVRKQRKKEDKEHAKRKQRRAKARSLVKQRSLIVFSESSDTDQGRSASSSLRKSQSMPSRMAWNSSDRENLTTNIRSSGYEEERGTSVML